MASSEAIGIDLGTTNSCVAVFLNGKVVVIANAEGSRTTPSYVAFTEDGRLIGKDAKAQAARNSKNTIFDAKRLIGRRFIDVTVQNDKARYLFDIKDNNGKPVIPVLFKSEIREYSPEEISAMVLIKMKETAETYLGHAVHDAVITVPAYFNDIQRQATKDAATIAGLKAIRIINEPTAAALAYAYDQKIQDQRKVLVYDLGGGTLDVTILSVENGSKYTVLATSGDTHFGGEDFDQKMLAFLIDEFNKKHPEGDIKKCPRALQRLRMGAERAKRCLSQNLFAQLDIDSLHENQDFNTKLTRFRFEELCEDLFQKALGPVKTALFDSALDKEDIDDIVLVGGATRMPNIQKLLKDFFNKTPIQSINPDEAVAFGAAIQAAMLTNVEDPVIKKLSFTDVLPLGMGVAVKGDKMWTILRRNSRIPCTAKEVFTTANDYQTRALIGVYQGDSANVEENYFLHSFHLTGIPSALEGVERMDVTFSVDANGILTVTAVVRSTANRVEVELNVEHFLGRIDELNQTARLMAQEDTEQRQREAEFVEKTNGTNA